MKSHVEIDKGLVFRGSVSGLLASLVDFGLLLWVNRYLLRRISPNEYSLYPLVMAIMSFLMIVKGVLDVSNTRYVTEAYARGEIQEVTRISSTMFAYAAIVSLLLIALGGGLCWRITWVFSVPPGLVGDMRIMLAVVLASMVIGTLLSPLEAGMSMKQKFVAISAIVVGVEVFRLALVAVLLVAVSTRVLWVVVAAAAAQSLGAAVRAVVSMKLVPALRVSLRAVDFRRGREMLSFGGWNLIGGVMARIRTSADPIILNILSTPLQLSCFHIGNLFVRYITRVRIAATNAVQPSLIAMHATDQIGKLRETFMKFGRIVSWAYMLVALPLMIFASEIIRLYAGVQFAAASLVTVLVLAGEIPILGISMIPQLVTARGCAKSSAVRGIIVQVVNLALTIYFVGPLRLGALGSALGSLLSAGVLRSALLIPLGLRLAEVDLRTWLVRTVAPGLVPALAGTAVWLALKLLCRPSSWLELLAFGAAGAIVYVFVLVRFSLQPGDKTDLKRLVSLLIRRRKE